MEIAIIKRESTGTGANTYNETETVAKFEIMDGAPVRGEGVVGTGRERWRSGDVRGSLRKSCP